MSCKFIFLDIDGTIYDKSTGVTKETIDSINAAKNKGNKVFICTGRPKSEMIEEIKCIDFDGYIFSSGAHIEIDKKTLFFSEINHSNLKTLLKELNQKNLGMLVQGTKRCFFNTKSKNIIDRIYFSKMSNSELRRLQSPENNIYFDISKLNIEEDEISKIVLLTSNLEDLKEIESKYSNEYDVIIYGKKEDEISNGEILQKGINKATGIQKVLSYFNASQKDTICFGDSRNDLEMIKFCEIGVCMGNGEDQIKKISDYVCESIFKNGVSKSFEKYNLI